jgi:hypothetical protein
LRELESGVVEVLQTDAFSVELKDGSQQVIFTTEDEDVAPGSTAEEVPVLENEDAEPKRGLGVNGAVVEKLFVPLLGDASIG